MQVNRCGVVRLRQGAYWRLLPNVPDVIESYVRAGRDLVNVIHDAVRLPARVLRLDDSASSGNLTTDQIPRCHE